MGAVSLVTQLLRPEQVAVVPHDCYGGTYRLFNALHLRGALQVRFVDFQDAAALDAAIAARPALVWIETPSNPLLRITDVEALARRAHEVGALVAVDNTFLSPGWQKPLELGADIVVHSTTKYLNGHSDVVGGAVVCKTQELHDQIAWWANCLGLTGSPFDSFLPLRGLRTLQARLAVHGRNADALASWLDQQPEVAKVYYPGLPSHPGHDVARRQQTGFGAIVTFELKGGTEAVKRFVKGLEFFSLRRIARRRGKPGQPSGGDDPRLDSGRSPQCLGRDRQPGPAQRRRRGRHRPLVRYPTGAVGLILAP